VKVDWAAALHGMVVPTIPGTAAVTMIVAIFGTTISPYLFFWQASQEVEEIDVVEEPAVVGAELEGGAERLVRGGPQVAPDSGFDLREVGPRYSGCGGALGLGHAEFLAAGADFRPVHLVGGGWGLFHGENLARAIRGF
jgi:hypothetical protein